MSRRLSIQNISLFQVYPLPIQLTGALLNCYFLGAEFFVDLFVERLCMKADIKEE